MPTRDKSSARPRFQQCYPDQFATPDELHAAGLRPGTTEPDAILTYDHGDRSGLCALYDRAKALPITHPAK